MKKSGSNQRRRLNYDAAFQRAGGWRFQGQSARAVALAASGPARLVLSSAHQLDPPSASAILRMPYGCPTCELLPEPEGSGSHMRRGPAGPGWLFSPDHKGHNTPRVTDSKTLCSFLTTSLNQDLTKSFQFTNLATSKQNHRS